MYSIIVLHNTTILDKYVQPYTDFCCDQLKFHTVRPQDTFTDQPVNQYNYSRLKCIRITLMGYVLFIFNHDL